MKKKTLLVAIAAIGLTMFLVSCNDESNIVKIDKDEYEELKTAADKWKEVDKLSEDLLARKVSPEESKNTIIDTTSGDNYILSYKNSKVPPPRPSAGVDFDRESLAFMIKYMLDNNIDKVRAGFGIYSNAGSPKKDGFGTIIFGLPKKVSREEWEKNPKETALTPFSYTNKRKSNAPDSASDKKGYLNWGEVSP